MTFLNILLSVAYITRKLTQTFPVRSDYLTTAAKTICRP